jgi:hypothetical protein
LSLPAYVGNCEWEPSGEPERKTPPNELPTLTEPWMGRMDKVEAFRGIYAVRSAYLGGYIIDNTPKSNSPFQGMASVDLVVALPPDFSQFLSPGSTSIKTAQINVANIGVTGVIPGADHVDGSRSVSYFAPETTYLYFAPVLPTAPRFSGVVVPTVPRVLRSIITATANSVTKNFTGALAPSALVTALTMPPVDKLQSFSPDPIPGTPWYRVTETWARELQGDS